MEDKSAQSSENSFQNQQDQTDKKLDLKFDYLLNEIFKNQENNIKLFNNLDSLIQNKYKSFVSKIASKAELKCQKEIETLKVYTEYDPKYFINNNNYGTVNLSLNNLKPNQGYEKEFEEAIKNLEKCTDSLISLGDLNSSSGAARDLIDNSTNMCVQQCRKDFKTYRHSESEVRKCLDACVRYRKYNIEAYYKLIFDVIEGKEKLMEKI